MSFVCMGVCMCVCVCYVDCIEKFGSYVGFLNLSLLFFFSLLFRFKADHFLREKKNIAEECFGKHNLKLK